MSQPRTRSQGLPYMEVREDIEEPAIPGSSPTERRMLQKLQVKLEVLRLYPAQKDKEGEISQTQPELTRSISDTMRPPSMILPELRWNSALGIVILEEVSTKFNQYHVPIHNSTVEDGKQNHTCGISNMKKLRQWWNWLGSSRDSNGNSFNESIE